MAVTSSEFVLNGTPIEKYEGVYVKRDDLCCDDPGLMKVRGLYRFVARRKSFKTFGILDGRHSRNGWALARVCSELGKRSVTYWPRLKAQEGSSDRETEGGTRNEARRLGATTVPIQAGRSAVVFAAAKKHLAEFDPNSSMIPNAVKIEETIDAVRDEVQFQSASWKKVSPKSLVVPVGSGTMLAGILSGMFRIGMTPIVYAVLGYSQNETRLRGYLKRYSLYPQEQIEVVDLNLPYGSSAEVVPPFPSCPHYEAIAWEWMSGKSLDGPVAFWNGGN